MKFFEQFKKTDIDLLKERVDQGEAIKRMMESEGWLILDAHLKEQLQAYSADNATNAKDWDDYQKKAGKIFGIKLLLTDMEDFIRQGETAGKEIDEREGR